MRPPTRAAAGGTERGRPLRSALRLPLVEQLLLVPVLALALAVEVALRVVPVRRLARWLGVPLELAAGRATTPAVDPNPPLTVWERRAGRAVLRVMRHWPFGDGSCLRQSLVLGALLRHRRPALRIGPVRAGDTLLAHAWLEVSGATVGDHGLAPFRVADHRR